MHFIREIVLVLLVAILAVLAQDVEVVVKIPNGQIRGIQSGKIYSFKGIPYAEPPVGEKRFEPVGINREKWSGVRDATDYGAYCIQMSHMGYSDEAKVMGEEDCLFLNVFTTSMDSDRRLPVFFYIHGGAFMFGGGALFTPERILELQEAVFVTINYRVGAMGFLSTEDEVVPGNMGLKDQVVALQWVRENIHLFGGDAGSVTITGLSAGGASTHLHYFSPLSAGLFHRGFSQSGCALNPWVLAENSKKKVTAIAVKLGCPARDNIKMINCLKSRPAEKVVRGAKLFLPWLYNPFSPFGVVVEKKGSHPFLPEHPEDLLRAGKVAQVPWIVSLTDSEGLYPVADFVDPPSKLEEINRRWDELAPALLDYEGTVGSNDQTTVAKIIRTFYFENEEINEKNFNKLVQMFSDRLFDAGISLSARLHGQYVRAPNYLIRYTYPAIFGVQHFFAPRFKFTGAGHGDDNMVVYKTSFRTVPLTSREKEMVELYAKFFISYAMGKPRIGLLSLLPIKQDPKLPFIHIQSPKNISLEVTMGFGNEKFWYSLPISEYSKWNAPRKPERVEL
uniref:Carboxylic ester hydrolase n=1 Tax=Lutzomyia longipalpis TaxID=7200 RepID=A0A7G3ABR5_LUTLO